MNAMAERCRAVQDEAPAVESQGTPIGEFLNPERLPVTEVVFDVDLLGELFMKVRYVDGSAHGVSAKDGFPEVGAMLGRLQAVAQGIHKIPREQLEQMSKMAAIRERDMRDEMAGRGGQ